MMSNISMQREQQIRQCQTPRLGYIAAHSDANKRLKKGDSQNYCKTCQRWQWKDQQCSLFEHDWGIEAFYKTADWKMWDGIEKQSQKDGK